MQAIESAFYLRQANALEDLPFVEKTWKHSEGGSTGFMEGDYFTSIHAHMMRGIMGRAGTQVIVASPNGDDAIAGWACLGMTLGGDSTIVFYVYVHPDSRRSGIARMLLGSTQGKKVIYTARPPREKDADGRWASSRVPIPKDWRYIPRFNYYDE